MNTLKGLSSDIVAKIVWNMSEKYNNNDDISCLTTDIGKEIGLSEDERLLLRDSVVKGLKEMSGETLYTENEMDFGYVSSIDSGIYWWDNKSETRWVIDMPDWWQTSLIKNFVDKNGIDVDYICNLGGLNFSQDKTQWISKNEKYTLIWIQEEEPDIETDTPDFIWNYQDGFIENL